MILYLTIKPELSRARVDTLDELSREDAIHVLTRRLFPQPNRRRKPRPIRKDTA